MELGNILGKLKGREKEEPKKFLALVLTDEVVQAAVWSILEEKTEIIAIGTPVEWDGDTGTTSELITAVDATISNAVEGLKDEPNEVILGIPHSWIDKDGVLGVKREFINKIRKELDLKALGYVTITDSILSYLKMQEGTPTTSILIQVSRDELTLVLVRLGHIELIETIGRGDDVVEDVTEGIARFKIIDNLPSRIILFNSMHNLDEIIQNLLSVNWQTQFNFLHLPKIEALPKDVTIRALSVAGGSEVAKSLGFSVSETVLDPAGPGLAGPDDLPARPGPNGNPDPVLLTAQEIGFVEEKIDFIDPEDEPPVPDSTPLTPGVKGSHTPGVFAPRVKFSLPKIHLPSIKFNLPSATPRWWYLGGALLGLGLLAFWLVWILPKATITVMVLPKTLDQDVEITLSTTDSSINFSDKIVPAEVESVSESGQKMVETTGKKTVGDPAKGTVTIYNKTTSPKTFSKGTTLSSGNLKFTLDNDVSIASASSTTEGITFGKNTIAITAATIGSESNLTASTEFSIASFGKDSYVAKNEEALTGGSSEEVRVVGKDDQKLLVSDLTNELLKNLETKLIGSSSPGIGVYLIPDSAKVEDVTYSAKIGEKENTLTANMTIKATLLRYKTEDVVTLVNSEIDQAVPPGYVRSGLPSTVDVTASSVGGSDSSVRGNAKVKVALLPIIDTNTIQTSLKGKRTTAIENILTQAVPGYQSAVVQITPRWIPTRLKSIPYNSSNILLNITPGI